MRGEVETLSAEAVAAAEAEVGERRRGRSAKRATRWRALQQEAPDARAIAHAQAEREAGRDAARLSALDEAKARADGEPRRGGRGRAKTAQRALQALAPASRRRGAACQRRAARSTAPAGRLAEVRAEAQALAREAEIRATPLTAIAAERQAWSERSDGAAAQLATLASARRRGQARAREASRTRPRAFAEKRRALIGEIETAEAVAPQPPPMRSR